MRRVRIAVLVSGGGTNLQALLDAESSGVLSSGEVALVIANREDAYAVKRAEAAGVKTLCITKAAYPAQADFETALCDSLAAAEIELVVLAGFMRILGSYVTERYVGRMVNVHPSLIPAFSGAGFYGLNVHEAALAAGVKLTGATVHLVNEVPDGGEILLQKAVRVRKNDTAETLQKRVMEEAEWVLLPRACEMLSKQILKGRI